MINSYSIRKRRCIPCAAQNAISGLLCLMVVAQYLYLIAESGMNSGFVINLSKLFFGVLYFIIFVLLFPYIKIEKVILLLVGCTYLLLRTLIGYRVYNLLLINIPMLIALCCFPEIRMKRKYFKRITVCSTLCFLILYCTSYIQNGFLINRVFDDVAINRNLVGMVVVVNTYMMLATFSNYQKRRISFLQLIVYIASFAIGICLQSRTTLICLGIIILGHMFLVRRSFDKKKLYYVLICCILLAIISPILIAFVIAPILNIKFGYSIFSGREMIYKDVVQTIFSLPHFLLGYGFEQFTAWGGTQQIWHAHNQWLQYALNYGLIFVAYMIVVHGTVFREVLFKSNKKTSQFLILMQIVLCMYSMMETIYYIYYTSFMIFQVFLTMDTSDKRSMIVAKQRVLMGKKHAR